MLKINNKGTTQPAFTCSKLTMETLEQAGKMFKINNKDSGLCFRYSSLELMGICQESKQKGQSELVQFISAKCRLKAILILDFTIPGA